MLSEYGINLLPLQEEDLELIRFWRNSDKIKKYAKNQNYITKNMHKQWFENIKGYYFIIQMNNKKIGLIWLGNVDNYYESGFYIYENKYLNNIYSYKIVTILHKFAFYKLNLEEIYCEILENNKRAIRFNKSLGFQKVEGIKYKLTKENFEKSLNKFETILKKY